MNILYTSVAISQLKCLDYAFFVAKMSKMTFTRFGGQVLLDGGQVGQFRGRAAPAALFLHVFVCVFNITQSKSKHLKGRIQLNVSP